MPGGAPPDEVVASPFDELSQATVDTNRATSRTECLIVVAYSRDPRG
jgi:hypothetical protein